jgi:hypothetical protein
LATAHPVHWFRGGDGDLVFIVGLVTFPALSDALLPPTIYPGYPG